MLVTECIAKRNNLSYRIVGVMNDYIHVRGDKSGYRLCITTGVIEPWEISDTLIEQMLTSGHRAVEPTTLKIQHEGRTLTANLTALETKALGLGVLKPEDFFVTKSNNIHLQPNFDGIGGERTVAWRRFKSQGPFDTHYTITGMDVRPLIISFFEGKDADKITKGTKSMYGYQIRQLEQNYLAGGYTLGMSFADLIDDVMRASGIT